MISLPILREQNELSELREQTQKLRFERQRRDDSRTAIPSEAARELEHQLRRRIEGEVRTKRSAWSAPFVSR